jgi:hypothetical protein
VDEPTDEDHATFRAGLLATNRIDFFTKRANTSLVADLPARPPATSSDCKLSGWHQQQESWKAAQAAKSLYDDIRPEAGLRGRLLSSKVESSLEESPYEEFAVERPCWREKRTENNHLQSTMSSLRREILTTTRDIQQHARSRQKSSSVSDRNHSYHTFDEIEDEIIATFT